MARSQKISIASDDDRAKLPSAGPNPAANNTAVFSKLQKLNRVNLLVPEGHPHMYHAAINSGVVRLTALGEHYRRLAQDEVI